MPDREVSWVAGLSVSKSEPSLANWDRLVPYLCLLDLLPPFLQISSPRFSSPLPHQVSISNSLLFLPTFLFSAPTCLQCNHSPCQHVGEGVHLGGHPGSWAPLYPLRAPSQICPPPSALSVGLCLGNANSLFKLR